MFLIKSNLIHVQISNAYGWPSYEKCSFKVIDDHAAQCPREAQNSVESLANYLGRSWYSDLQKARAIYVWISHNIKYDLGSLKKGVHPGWLEREGWKPENVLMRGLAVCAGYSELYKELADKLGLQCQYISGYSKGSGWDGKIPTKPNRVNFV